MHNHDSRDKKRKRRLKERFTDGMVFVGAQFESLPVGLRCSAGVDGKEKSTGDGGGAGVSLTS